jgi:hypothetical protein
VSPDIVVKGIVAQSAFEYVKEAQGQSVWSAVLERLSDADRVAVSAGGNVPLAAMGRFNVAFVEVACGGSRTRAQDEFRRMGAKSAEKLLLGNGIFSIFARFVSPKQVLARAENVIKTAYPGVAVDVVLSADEAGGVITMHGMSGYPYGSQRVVGWLLRGLEIVGGKDARVAERNWEAGRIDSDTYEIDVAWEGWH